MGWIRSGVLCALLSVSSVCSAQPVRSPWPVFPIGAEDAIKRISEQSGVEMTALGCEQGQDRYIQTCRYICVTEGQTACFMTIGVVSSYGLRSIEFSFIPKEGTQSVPVAKGVDLLTAAADAAAETRAERNLIVNYLSALLTMKILPTPPETADVKYIVAGGGTTISIAAKRR